MIELNRRRLLQGSTALGAGTALLGGTSLLDWARAWADEMPFKPEKDAKLRALRWNRFVETEDIQFDKNIVAFTKATGIPVRLDKEFMDDIQPKAAVAANVGAGPDIVWGPNTTPHLFPDKLLDMTDVADYLGKKYGGWYPIAEVYGKSGGRWICIPLCWGGNYINYRSSWVKDAGFEKFPDNTDDFLKLSKELNKMGHPGGFALGHASGDGNAWVHWLVWAFGGKLLTEDNQVAINSPETKMALEYVRELYPSFVQGTASWNDSSNNKAFLAGDISYTNNGISIYAAANAPEHGRDRRGHGPRLLAGRPGRQADRDAGRVPVDGVRLHRIPGGLQGVHDLHDGGAAVQRLAGTVGWLFHPDLARLRRQSGLGRRIRSARCSPRRPSVPAASPTPATSAMPRRRCWPIL